MQESDARPKAASSIAACLTFLGTSIHFVFGFCVLKAGTSSESSFFLECSKSLSPSLSVCKWTASLPNTLTHTHTHIHRNLMLLAVSLVDIFAQKVTPPSSQ